MPTISISFSLDAEQMDALTETVAEVNAQLPQGVTPWTAETFLADQNKVYVASRAAHYYEAALTRFGEGFKVADYDTRKAIMAGLEAQLPQT